MESILPLRAAGPVRGCVRTLLHAAADCVRTTRGLRTLTAIVSLRAGGPVRHCVRTLWSP